MGKTLISLALGLGLLAGAEKTSGSDIFGGAGPEEYDAHVIIAKDIDKSESQKYFADSVINSGKYVFQEGDSWSSVAGMLYGTILGEDRPLKGRIGSVLANALAWKNGEKNRLSPVYAGDTIIVDNMVPRMVLPYDTPEQIAQSLGMTTDEFFWKNFWISRDVFPAGSIYYEEKTNQQNISESQKNHHGSRIMR